MKKPHKFTYCRDYFICFISAPIPTLVFHFSCLYTCKVGHILLSDPLPLQITSCRFKKYKHLPGLRLRPRYEGPVHKHKRYSTDAADCPMYLNIFLESLCYGFQNFKAECSYYSLFKTEKLTEFIITERAVMRIKKYHIRISIIQ